MFYSESAETFEVNDLQIVSSKADYSALSLVQ